MRRKITAAEEAADDLPDLTEQQMSFWRLRQEGKRPVEAYRLSYDCSAMSDPAVWTEASRLCNHPKIALWDAAAAKAEIGRVVRTKEQHMLRLNRLQQIALDTGNVGAAVQAEQLIGKVEGHYVEQYRDLTRDPLDSLREIAAVSPQLAAQLAKEQGIAWDEQPTAH